ncbi:GntR family transcriptional regulator [Sphingomonas sp. AR_OL41]|uniref:GntR family transcriptional regulator n=1 Tax=Sphingomonas sp. AR_OL41 TaxID=3042729 RepID=UPI0024817060|nr:GntR family transcriptional regulator [Sphingomonas sp. AR_OL41]MDH7974492.1 GntR family transcriptional regulator [Sphingomonas sp. AR_OL41]
MSPSQAMERSYAALRHLLRSGAFAPGLRLEANRLADEIGVSITPVRDALNRLVGERLVEASVGEGFRVPRLSEAQLRELYEWNAAILSIAVRTTPPAALAAAIASRPSSGPLPERTADLFARIAAAAPNTELRAAIVATSDRLHPFRMIESHILAPADDELDELGRVDQGQVQAIRRYHLRRIRAAPDLVRVRERPRPEPGGK